ncbi:unnamed protein product [Merluccius merluccius]
MGVPSEPCQPIVWLRIPGPHRGDQASRGPNWGSRWVLWQPLRADRQSSPLCLPLSPTTTTTTTTTSGGSQRPLCAPCG